MQLSISSSKVGLHWCQAGTRSRADSTSTTLLRRQVHDSENLAAPGVLACLVPSYTACVVAANFPAHREVCHDEKKAARSKSIGREEQSLHIAQAGAQEVSIPKTNFSEATIRQPEPARKRRRISNPGGAHSFYAVFSVRVIFLRFPHVVRAKPSLYRPAVLAA